MMLRRQWLKDNDKVKDGNYYKVIYTKTTQFLMPLIGYRIDDFLDYSNKVNFLINAYVIPEEYKIVIVCDNSDDPDLKELMLINDTNECFESSTTDDNDRELVLKYSIPEKYRPDIDIFLQSKYSKTSEVFKRKLISVYGDAPNTKDHRPSIYDVLYPTKFKKQQIAKDLLLDDISLIEEVYTKVDMDYERYYTVQELQAIKLEKIPTYEYKQ